MIGEDTYGITDLQAIIQGNCVVFQVVFYLGLFKLRR